MMALIRYSAVLIATFCVLAGSSFGQGNSGLEQHLLWPAEAILSQKDCVRKVVAQRLNIKERLEISAPEVKTRDQVTLAEYQDAVEKFWGWRPDGIVNVYNPVTNQIFLNTQISFYLPRGRTIFDSLVHEYVHFFQMKYLGRDPSDEENENEAVQIQNWFRETYGELMKGFEFSCVVR